MESTGLPENKIYKISKIKAYLIAFLIFILALGIGAASGWYLTFKWTKKIISSIIPVRENNFKYKFIYPLLGYNFSQAKNLTEDKTIKKILANYVDNQYKNKAAESISIYYRDLFSNNWSGVNENTQYHPGSMMKVLIMVGYFREYQLNPTIFDKTFQYSKDMAQQTDSVTFGLPSQLVQNNNYTVKQLITEMIVNSDNGAETLLINNLDRNVLNAVYYDLNITNPDSVQDFTLSPAQYSDFLKILYNATYLTEINSELALQTMSQTTFKDGLVAGVPQNIPVSQKYGERVDADSSNKITDVELHNCGIIYAKNHPYVLCVMTKKAFTNTGTGDEKALASIIKDISAITYNYVDGKK